MDQIQQKFRQQNYVIKGICSNNKIMNIKWSLMKQLIIFLTLLIFIIIFYSQKKTAKNLQKIYKRKLEDFWGTDNDRSDIDIDTDTVTNTDANTDIVFTTTIATHNNTETYTTYTTQETTVFITENINTNIETYILYDTAQETTDFITEEQQTTPTNEPQYNCSAIEFFINYTKCNISNKNKEDDTNFINYIIDQIQEGKLKELFNRTIEEDTNYIAEENNIIYQISTVSSQYSTNLSKVSLENCEQKLKDAYFIDKEEKLILLKLEHYVENIKIPIIEYQLFTKDGKKLNLSYCNSIPELVSIPVDIDERKEFIYDPNSDFYHDKCFVYTSEYGTDLTIYDRKNNFNKQFLSLCEKDCDYKGYNKSNSTASCECKTKNEFPKYTTQEVELTDLVYQFIKIKKEYTNFFVLTCTKVLFTSKGFKTNFGSYYTIAIFAGIILLGIFFFLKRYHSLLTKIEGINEKKETYKQSRTESDFPLDIKIKKKPLFLDNNNSKPKNDGLEINNVENHEAKNLDKNKQWSFYQSYKSQIKKKWEPISICINDEDKPRQMKICLFLFSLSLNCAVEAMFFNDSTMHRIYKERGHYNFFFQLQIIIASMIISKLVIYLAERFIPSVENTTKIKEDSN